MHLLYRSTNFWKAPWKCNITDGCCRWERVSTSALINQWKCNEPSTCGQNDVPSPGVFLIWPFTCFTIVFTSVTEHSGTFELFQKNLYIRNRVTRFWGVQGRFLKRFVRGSGGPDPCISSLLWYDWQERVNKPATTTPAVATKKRRRKNAMKRTFRAATCCSPSE